MNNFCDARCVTPGVAVEQCGCKLAHHGMSQLEVPCHERTLITCEGKNQLFSSLCQPMSNYLLSSPLFLTFFFYNLSTFDPVPARSLQALKLLLPTPRSFLQFADPNIAICTSVAHWPLPRPLSHTFGSAHHLSQTARMTQTGFQYWV